MQKPNYNHTAAFIPTRSATMRLLAIELCVYMSMLQFWSVNGSNKQTFGYNAEVTDFDNTVCTGADVLQTISAPTDLFCAHVCVEDPLCVGFFYHKNDGVCVTTRRYFLQTTELSNYFGMKYFRGHLWEEWSGWSACSVTCESGSTTRTRACHTDSPYPCHGNTTETIECYTGTCPTARTCAELAERGLNTSAVALIDPSGSGTTVTVTCDLDLEPGKAITVLNHNRESETFVQGYEGLGSYSITLDYNIGIVLASLVADLSTECKQFLKWECHAALANECSWRTRYGNLATYFNGSPPPGRMCACGETNSCINDLPCNCDMNDYTLRKDEGYITDKLELPISGFEAGDTGNSGEYGYHTIGPLLCS